MKNTIISAICSVLSIIIFVGAVVYISFLFGIFDVREEQPAIKQIGETASCPNFDITVEKVQYKKKGTKVDSFTVISDPEWIGVTLKITNTSNEKHTFYNSDVTLQNSSGEILDSPFISYKMWGVESLGNPELAPSGTKTGYIQFNNTNDDNSNLILSVNCNDSLLGDDLIYTYDISKK